MILYFCRFGFPTEERASELRQAQSAKWAYKNVSEGIALFKANKHADAFLCLNKALSIDPNNVEALVARGALYVIALIIFSNVLLLISNFLIVKINFDRFLFSDLPTVEVSKRL